MDMAYFPDNFAHDHSPNEKAVARITYGRPQKNNRPVFGKMVPYGKIWRTGANEATEFIAYQPTYIWLKNITRWYLHFVYHSRKR